MRGWYAKDRGTVIGSNIALTEGRLQSAIGHKLSTNNEGDGKNLIRLTQRVTGWCSQDKSIIRLLVSVRCW